MKTVMIVATAVLALGSTAYAQQQQQQEQHPCMADAAKLCPNVEPGGGAQMQCLKTHQTELSPACKKHVMQTKTKKMEQQDLEKQQQQQPPEPRQAPPSQPAPSPPQP
jgi:hypothetical protein